MACQLVVGAGGEGQEQCGGTARRQHVVAKEGLIHILISNYEYKFIYFSCSF